MNPRLALLQPYPFERLRRLMTGIDAAAPGRPARAIDLSLGEPKHPTPAVVRDAFTGAVAGLASYPATAGSAALRASIADWIGRRHGVTVDAATEVLPINGSREALFAFAQVVVDPADGAVVVAPNPFYQIYEGAALLAGAGLVLVDQAPDNGLRCDWSAVPESVWRRTRLVYVCSPGNPTGAVMPEGEWRTLFAAADRHGFVIASDECYSEIYLDDAQPPLGALAASRALGRPNHERIVVFSSLSKRSNVPGMRSGFVAGDARLLASFLKYRTYHGSAMGPAIQTASIAAWNEESHVVANRAAYRAKFDAVVPILAPVLPVTRPQAGFYLWVPVPGGDDAGFARQLNAEANVLVLPGSYLGRDGGLGPDGSAGGRGNPGRGFIRIALVDSVEACIEGAERIARFVAASG